jgi:hypothetical protein
MGPGCGEILSLTKCIHVVRYICDMTPESRNSEVRIDVHC